MKIQKTGLLRTRLILSRQQRTKSLISLSSSTSDQNLCFVLLLKAGSPMTWLTLCSKSVLCVLLASLLALVLLTVLLKSLVTVYG